MGCKLSMPAAYAEDMIKKYFDPGGLKPSGRFSVRRRFLRR